MVLGRLPVAVVSLTWRKELIMTEFLQNYGFFILVAIVMLFCHMGHGGHGHKGRDESDKGSGGESEHQH